MGGFTGEEVAEGIERWLKARRDEARDAFVQGQMPWHGYAGETAGMRSAPRLCRDEDGPIGHDPS